MVEDVNIAVHQIEITVFSYKLCLFLLALPHPSLKDVSLFSWKRCMLMGVGVL